MKKYLTFYASIMASVMISTSIGAAAQQIVSVTLNGDKIDVYPIIENDTVLLPVRIIAETLNFEVIWDSDNKTVFIGDKIELSPENIKIIDDRAYASLSSISEIMDLKAEYDKTSDTIKIEENNHKGFGENNRNDGEHGMGMQIKTGAQGDRQPNTETDPDIVNVINEGAEKFSQAVFEDSETGISLEYSLYIPEDYDPSEKYPLLMYIPDASGASKSAKELVEQYYGADIWVTDDEQAKHKAFVVVPAFSEVVVDDDWNTSEQIETAVNLINNLSEQYNIDTNRLYTTGQSMGCMTSLYLNSKYPDLFAASLYVSGQWDISVLTPLENQKFFYITAGGDEKASGGQDEVKAMLEKDDISYSYGTWSAQNSETEQSADAEALIANGNNINMIRFEKGSVLNGAGGMEHNASFNYGYKIPAVRDWLFNQSK